MGLRQTLTAPSSNPDQKYFRLSEPWKIAAEHGVPETIYTYLYIRKPDPYRHHIGDIDFYLPDDQFRELKHSLASGRQLQSARIFPRTDLDMIELYHPDVDALGYISAESEITAMHVKIAN